MGKNMFLKVKNGDVISVNEAGNLKNAYYRGGDAERAYWSDMGTNWVEVYLKNGKILILNEGGNLRRTI